MSRRFGFALGVWSMGTAVALAQDVPQTLNPDGWSRPAPPAPPPAAPAPQVIPGQPGEGSGAPAETGYYYTDDVDAPQTSPHWDGQVPETHVVRTGDTLWDICDYYFSNPWQWPKVWAQNPSITNPHWIYPGDLVRLLPGGSAPAEPPPGALDEPVVAGAPRPTGVNLRQLAFVTTHDLQVAGRVIGSSEEKVMLAEGDEIYVEYPEGKPPQVGQRYAIYTAQRSVTHPESGEEIGAYVVLHGEIEILGVKKEKRARARITYSTDVIERGHRVGTVKTQFKQVPQVSPDRDLEGVIVATLQATEHRLSLVGEGQVVILDRGESDGLKIGNRLLVIRRGDAYQPRMGPHQGGHDDRRYPDHPLAQIAIVETGKTTSIGVVTYSNQETEIGDHVVMRKGK